MRLDRMLLTGLMMAGLFSAATAQADDSRQEYVRIPEPVILLDEIKEGIQPMPPNTPVQRWIVGRGQVDGGVSGATGTQIYKNTLGTNFFAPGTNLSIADDLLTVSAGSCGMTWFEVEVFGGGNGTGPGFSTTFSLWDGCPNQGGTMVPGTLVTEALPNNGAWLVSMDYEGMEVTIPPNPWLRLSVNNATAGWVFGRPAEIGFTQSLFDHPMFPCNAWFGPTPPNPYSGFYASLYCGGDVPTQFEAYRADVFSGFLDEIALNEMWADDIVPITAPAANCEFVRFESLLSGLLGAFTMNVAVYTHDETNNRPLAPVMGLSKNCPGSGNMGAVTTCTHTVFPPVEVPTPQMWLVYDVISGAVSGPVLAGDFPAVGFSEDGFAIFGMPDPGVWSGPVWFYGGCPGDDPNDPTPCGTFLNTINCFGTAPMGACCDLAGAELCTNDTTIQECGPGRWMPNSACEADPFDPPCGTAACCTVDGCSNMTAEACAGATGQWQPGMFCEGKGQSCPPGACLMATNACSEENLNAPGCNNGSCCALVCGIDAFCCETAWDSSCVNLAAGNCPEVPVNDQCSGAIAIGNGTFEFNTTLATTDGTNLPASCEEGGGLMLGQDVWYNYTAPTTGNATVTLCGLTDYDSRIAVYMGCGCPATNGTLVECDDDACDGDPPMDLQSEMSFPVTAGQCYKLRVGGWNAEVGTGSFTVGTKAGTSCPAGAVAFTNPLTGTIDARQPHPVNSTTPAQGISTITATAPAGGSSDCWSLCETANTGTPNSIMNVAVNGMTYTITLARPITPGAVTTLSYTDNNALTTTGSFTAHPGNVNGDSVSAPTDILRLIDCLNMINPMVNCPWGIYSRDIDQSGAFGPADILREIDILNGADALTVWNGTSLPTNNGVCP